MKTILPALALLLAACVASPAPTPMATDEPSPAASATRSAPTTITPAAEPTATPADTPSATDVGRTLILVPAAIAARPELPWCGHEIVERRGEGDVYDAGVRACWLEAYRSGRPAEFVSTGWTPEGGRVRTFYRSVGDDGFEVLTDWTGDPASDREWHAARCGSMHDAHTDPRGTAVFVEDDCQPIAMPGASLPVPWPSLHERLVLESLVAFAVTGDASTLEALPLTDEVALGLADQVLVHRPAEALGDPASWSLARDEFRGYVGPFSALDLLARWDGLPGQSVREVQISIGNHPHCASPAVAAPAELATLRRVSLQPMGQTSCLAWWTVDAYLTEDGRIAGVTLDLWEP
jgi:hypothetical protein